MLWSPELWQPGREVAPGHKNPCSPEKFPSPAGEAGRGAGNGSSVCREFIDFAKAAGTGNAPREAQDYGMKDIADAVEIGTAIAIYRKRRVS